MVICTKVEANIFFVFHILHVHIRPLSVDLLLCVSFPLVSVAHRES